MRVLRPFLWAAVLVAGFLYLTSGSRWDVGRFLRPVGNSARLWTEPESAQTAGFSTDEQNNIDIYKLARQATVNITSVVYREGWFFQLYPEKGTGSGFLINAEGQILTNHHVIGGNAQLTVTLADKKVYKAKVLGSDPRNDLALIQIQADKKLPFLKLGDSDHLIVGQKVLAIGNPFGLEGTLTTGVVSSLGRTLQTDERSQLEGMIQTDAAINPGNSGGPLLDSHGNVIGINTAIYGSQGSIGIGFAMPIGRAKAMLEEFHARGRITRPALGIVTVYVAGDLAEMLRLPPVGGLLIQRVERGSAAEDAGLRGPSQRVVVGGTYPLGVGGDFIMAVEGQPIEGNDTLTKAMNRKRAGDSLRLTIFRGGKSQEITVKLGEAPQTL
jgi:S1-C subfamily serine protease